jgi:hypothetical protein
MQQSERKAAAESSHRRWPGSGQMTGASSFTIFLCLGFFLGLIELGLGRAEVVGALRFGFECLKSFFQGKKVQ